MWCCRTTAVSWRNYSGCSISTICKSFSSHISRYVNAWLLAERCTTPEGQCGVIYKISCTSCNATYIGETGRRLCTRVAEDRKSVEMSDRKSAISDHVLGNGHTIDWDSATIIAHDKDLLSRKIREAVLIHQKRPEMNRDRGYQLSPVYGSLLGPVSYRGQANSTI